MNRIPRNDSDRRLRQLVEKGANVVGATTGAAVALVTGEPMLAIGAAGVKASGIYKAVGAEIADRLLAPREEGRIGGVLALSAQYLGSALAHGKMLRDDGFFDTPEDGRPDAEEVLEGVLRKAQSEYEERKLPYLARLWSNACLDKNLDSAELNYLSKLSEQLTYRQLVIIAIVGAMAKADGQNVFNLRKEHYEDVDLNVFSATAIILSEVIMLHNLNCIQIVAPLGVVQVTPSKMRIGTHGGMLYNVMELHRIPRSDFQEVIDLLGEQLPPGSTLT